MMVWLLEAELALVRKQFLFSSDAAEELKEAISKKNYELVYLYDLNLVDIIWKESRPQPPSKPIRVHDLKYAGLDMASKLSSLRSGLVDASSSAIVISMLDEVAWLLNLRGSDAPHSPVTYAYLIVEIGKATLFVDDAKVTPDVMKHLKNTGVELKPYDSILSEIKVWQLKVLSFVWRSSWGLQAIPYLSGKGSEILRS